MYRHLSMLWRSPVSRVQLALNVSNIDAAIDFYSKLFATEPTKRQPGYANFAITEPPLKLVLIENPQSGGAVSAVPSIIWVLKCPRQKRCKRAIRRLAIDGLDTDVEMSTTCCYAVQDKVWTNDPDGAPWEVYAVFADASEETELGCGTESCAPRGTTTAIWCHRLLGYFVLLTPLGRSRGNRWDTGSHLATRSSLSLWVRPSWLGCVGSGIAAQQLSPGNTGLQLFETRRPRPLDFMPLFSCSAQCRARTLIPWSLSWMLVGPTELARPR